MAQPLVPKLGVLCAGKAVIRPNESVFRADHYNEARICECEIRGLYEDLEGSMHPGDPLPRQFLQRIGGFGWYIRTVDLERDTGNEGIAKVSFVFCPNGPKEPFAETWEVSMDAVSMKLRNHPSLAGDDEALAVIRAWEEDTPARYKVIKKENGGQTAYKYYFVCPQETDGAELIDRDAGIYVKEITSNKIKRVLFAEQCGIESYNDYLPVIRHVSQYLRMPGGNYNEAGQLVGGKLTKMGAIGQFDTPPFTVAGYEGGLYFKNRDSWTSNSDGTATRNEEWTFFKDLRHTWIYTENEKVIPAS